MIRHQQAGHDLAVDDMPFHDFRDVGVRFDAVPHAFGIDDDAGPLRTMIQAAGLVRPHDVLQVQALGFRLEAGVQGLRAQFRAAAPRILRGALVDTDEDMALERRQRIPVCYACMVAV